MSTEHPDIPSEVPARRAASLSVTHLVSSYDTITPAMAAAAVLGDATKARQVDLFSTGADETFVESVLGVADALTALRGERQADSVERPRALAWAVLDTAGVEVAVERSRVVAQDMAEREGWRVAPLVLASLDDVEEGS